MSSWQNPSTASAATRKTPPACQASHFRRRQHRHPGRRGHHAPAHRIQGHDERPVPEGSSRENPPRDARANRRRQVRRRTVLRIPSRQGDQRRNGHDGRARNRTGRSNGCRTHFPRVHRGRVAEADRQEPESCGRTRPVRWPVEFEHHLRQREARNRDSQQRTVRRPPGLESASLREESRTRESACRGSTRHPSACRGKSRSCGSFRTTSGRLRSRARNRPGTR